MYTYIKKHYIYTFIFTFTCTYTYTYIHIHLHTHICMKYYVNSNRYLAFHDYGKYGLPADVKGKF